MNIHTGVKGYKVVASEAPSAHSGGVVVFYCVEEHFSVEALQLFGANVASFQLALGSQQWYIIGCYLVPDNVLTIEAIGEEGWSAWYAELRSLQVQF